VTSTSVEIIETGDRARSVAALSLAFATDPVMRWIWPDPHRYVTYWPRFVDAFGGGAFDHGTAHWLGDGRAVALWLPPGAGPNDDALAALMAESLDSQTLGDLSLLSEQMAQLHPSVEHWYLAITGVDPTVQSQGLGSTLLRHGLAICDRDETPAYLEASSPRSRALYQRLGFEVVEVVQAGSSPPLWAMLREPRAGT
jgi:GNAT superfamily N-acetyltransferase